MKTCLAGWRIRLLSKMGYKSHLDDPQYISPRYLKKLRDRVIIFIIILSLISFLYIIVSICTKKPSDNARSVLVDLEGSARVNYPYDNIKSFIQYSDKCTKVGDYFTSNTRELVTMRKDEKEWSMINMTTLFSFMQAALLRDSEYGVYSVCSTMLSLRDIPCGCVLRLNDASVMWVLNIDTETLHIENYLKSDLIAIRERTYMFRSMEDAIVTNIVPKKLSVKMTICSKKGNVLDCKEEEEIFGGTDVLVIYRTLYFMEVDPKTYTISHPEFGKIEWDSV